MRCKRRECSASGPEEGGAGWEFIRNDNGDKRGGILHRAHILLWRRGSSHNQIEKAYHWRYRRLTWFLNQGNVHQRLVAI